MFDETSFLTLVSINHFCSIPHDRVQQLYVLLDKAKLYRVCSATAPPLSHNCLIKNKSGRNSTSGLHPHNLAFWVADRGRSVGPATTSHLVRCRLVSLTNTFVSGARKTNVNSLDLMLRYRLQPLLAVMINCCTIGSLIDLR